MPLEARGDFLSRRSLIGCSLLSLAFVGCGSNTRGTARSDAAAGAGGTAGTSGAGGTPTGAPGGGGGGGAAGSSAGASGRGGGAGGGGLPGTGGSNGGAGGSGGGGAGVGGGRASGGGGAGGAGGFAGGGGSTAVTCTNSCSVGAVQCASATSLAICEMADAGCPTFTASNCTSGLVCERYTPASCADPNWAEWPMPNSAPDVGTGAPNLESFTDNQDGTITDKVTGLMWQQDVAPYMYTLANATIYCQAVSLGGHDDWRLPMLIELVSLLDFGQTVNAYTPPPFTQKNVIFWTASGGSGYQLINGVPEIAWTVDFSSGISGSLMGTSTLNTRCVR